MAAQEIWHHPETGHERRITRPQRQWVGLECLEAARLHLGAQLLDVVERAQRLEAELAFKVIASPDPETTAMRPVKIDAVSKRPAKQRAHGDTKRFGLDVEAGVLDRRDRFVIDAADRHPSDCP